MSEVEVQNVANWMLANPNVLTGYTTLHSYSDYFMYPYSYAQKTYPPNVDTLVINFQVSLKGVNQIVSIFRSLSRIKLAMH